jgi:hypothetical protein
MTNPFRQAAGIATVLALTAAYAADPNNQNRCQDGTWAVFLGVGGTPEEVRRTAARLPQTTNPLTGRPFGQVDVYGFGRGNTVLEMGRAVTDHIGVPILSSSGNLYGQQYDHAVCHSNGCTKLFQAQSDGSVRVGHIYAFGTDSRSRTFMPGELRGAQVVFFDARGDIVPKIPAPSLAKINENTPGLVVRIPFDTPADIPRGVKNLVTKGRADDLPVVKLPTPVAQRATLANPVKPHFLLDSYFPATQKWMQQAGELQRQIRTQVDRSSGTASSGGGGGQGPPPGNGAGSGARGGVKADIRIDASDIRRRP